MPDVQPKNVSLKWTDHVGIMLALAATVLFAMSILAVSRGSLETAFEILRSSDSGSLALALTMRTLPVFSVIFYFLLGALAAKKLIRWPSPWIVALVVAPIILATPLLFLVVTAIMSYCSYWTIARNSRDKKPGAESRRRIVWLRKASPCLIVTGTLFLAMSIPPVWLPAEIVRTESVTEHGYVLASGDSHLRLLRDGDRSVVEMAVNDSTTRTLCTADGGWSAYSIFSLLGDSPDYPNCRDLLKSERP